MERYRDSLYSKILLTFILGFNSIGLLRAAEAPKYNMECFNDYVVTINCVLKISNDPLHDGNHSYWLKFEGGDTNCQTNLSSNIKKMECTLVNQTDHYYCTFNSTEPFIDTEYFVISLCSNENTAKLCLEMDNCYMPVHHIKPMAPINLKVYWSYGHYQFIWDSGYERCISKMFLKRLKYRLQYYKRGHPDGAITIHSSNKTQQIDSVNFEPGMEYIAKISSSPSQVYYKGQWSEWSITVIWRTNVSQDATPSAEVGSFSILACMLLGVLAFLCFHQINRCRIKSHCSVPTPAPYFQPLYSNYNGDFQSWLVSQSNLGDPIMMDETFIESKPMVNEERFLPLPLINPYMNVCGMAQQDKLDTLLLQSVRKSSFQVFCSPSLEQTGTSEDDSGCEDLVHSPASSWLHGAMSSFEPQSIWCSEDYCTLTDTRNDQEQGNSPSEVIPQVWL